MIKASEEDKRCGFTLLGRQMKVCFEERMRFRVLKRARGKGTSIKHSNMSAYKMLNRV